MNGHQQDVLTHVLNVTFPGTDVESFLINLDMAGVLYQVVRHVQQVRLIHPMY